MKGLSGLLSVLFLSIVCALGQSGPAPSPSPTPSPTPDPTPTASELKIHAGQSVYVVAMDTAARDTRMSSSRLEIERKAKEQFAKQRSFPISPVLKNADFVFVVAIDEGSSDFDEIAVAVSVPNYEANANSLDKLRNASVWQSDSHYHRGKEAGIAAATLGYSAFFRHPSVVKDLVKKFHKEVL
jgi:hypothetical protein